GEVGIDTRLTASVDGTRRASIARSHSATHLVHAAVRGAYGRRAAQAGSLNSPGRMRFDFTTPGAVSAGVLTEVEEEVNDYLRTDVEVRSYVTTKDKALELGAIALFGEKYGNDGRVVDMGEYSRELCGGTHVDVNGIALVAEKLADGVDSGGVRALATEIRNRLGPRPGVVALFAPAGEKVSFVVATNSAARDKGLAAGKLVPSFAAAVGGRGGGK